MLLSTDSFLCTVGLLSYSNMFMLNLNLSLRSASLSEFNILCNWLAILSVIGNCTR